MLSSQPMFLSRMSKLSKTNIDWYDKFLSTSDKFKAGIEQNLIRLSFSNFPKINLTNKSLKFDNFLTILSIDIFLTIAYTNVSNETELYFSQGGYTS